MRKQEFVAPILWVLLTPAVAFASGGRVPLFQSTPITSSGNYVLTRDIIDSGVVPLSIQASGVTVDLAGFKIERSDAAGPVIQISPGVTNVTVRRGSVCGGAEGVLLGSGLTPSAGISLIDLTIDGPDTDGIALANLLSCEIRGCKVNGAGRDGIVVDGFGELVKGRVVSNCVDDPVGDGIRVHALSGGEIADNLVLAAGDDAASSASGIAVLGSESSGGGNRVRANVVRDTRASGPGVGLLVGTPGNTVEDNTVTGGSGDGISVEGSSNRVVRNNVGENGGNGIVAAAGGGDGNDVSDNTALSNSGTGLLFDFSTIGNLYGGNRSCNNTSDRDDLGSNLEAWDNFFCDEQG